MKKIFDCHIHCSERADDILLAYARKKQLKYSLSELISMMEENEVYAGLLLSPPLEAGGIVPNEEIIGLCRRSHDKLFPVITVEPTNSSVEKNIKLARENKGYSKAFKILLGYYPVFPDDQVFTPLYEYAESSDMPVMFHTGDTATSDGSLWHAHPMNLDALANIRPNLKIVVCHLGNPWMQDAAELLYKHPNVFADISGLFVGGGKYSEEYLSYLSKAITEAIYFIGEGDKIMFGSDYPIETYSEAIGLTESLQIDKTDVEKILGSNAKFVFSL